VTPAVVAGLWYLFVRLRLGSPPNYDLELITFPPFKNYYDTFRYGWLPSGRVDEIIVGFAVLGLAAYVIVRFFRRRTLELAACVPYCALMPLYGVQLIYRSINSMRTLGPVITLLALDLYAARRREVRAARPAVT
jgi:hypothetical protein